MQKTKIHKSTAEKRGVKEETQQNQRSLLRCHQCSKWLGRDHLWIYDGSFTGVRRPRPQTAHRSRGRPGDLVSPAHPRVPPAPPTVVQTPCGFLHDTTGNAQHRLAKRFNLNRIIRKQYDNADCWNFEGNCSELLKMKTKKNGQEDCYRLKEMHDYKQRQCIHFDWIRNHRKCY